ARDDNIVRAVDGDGLDLIVDVVATGANGPKRNSVGGRVFNGVNIGGPRSSGRFLNKTSDDGIARAVDRDAPGSIESGGTHVPLLPNESTIGPTVFGCVPVVTCTNPD